MLVEFGKQTPKICFELQLLSELPFRGLWGQEGVKTSLLADTTFQEDENLCYYFPLISLQRVLFILFGCHVISSIFL